MSLLSSVKDVVIGQAMRLAGDPRVTKLVTDPRLMNAAMKAMTIGETLKDRLDQAGKLAGGMFGLVTQNEVSGMRGTIQDLEDQVAVLETRAAVAEAEVSLQDEISAAPAASAGNAKSTRARKAVAPRRAAPKATKGVKKAAAGKAGKAKPKAKATKPRAKAPARRG